MSKRVMVLLVILAMVLTGCSSGQKAAVEERSFSETPGPQTEKEAVEKEAEPEEEPYVYVKPEMKGEITVSIGNESEYLKTAAQAFMNQYPDIKVVINTFEDPSAQPTGEGYRTYLNTQIMAGKADDILFTASLPVKKYMEIGALADLSDFVAATPEMNEENYYMKALESARDPEGGLYVLPYVCNFETIGFNKALAAESKVSFDAGKKKISYTEAIEIAKKLVAGTSKNNAYVDTAGPTQYMHRLIHENIKDYVDVDRKQVTFDMQEYVELLNEVEEICGNREYFAEPGSINFLQDEYYMAMQPDWDMQSAFYTLLPEGDRCWVLPLADAEGNVAIYNFNCFGINNASPHKELAWEFLKFMLSDEIQSTPALWGLPVNRKGTEAYIKRSLELYNSGNQWEIKEGEMLSLLETWMEQINHCDMLDPAINDYFFFENKKFFDGEQSAEDTARTLYTRITQYLNE